MKRDDYSLARELHARGTGSDLMSHTLSSSSTNLGRRRKMTDDEKKQPEGSFRPGLVILRVILWTIIFSFLVVYLMGK
jgi:hypothetical protein